MKKRPASVKLENDGPLLTLRAVTVTVKSVGPTITVPVTSRLGSAGTAVTGYARPAWADSESGLCSVTVTLWVDSAGESVRAVTDFTTTYYRLPAARADSKSYPRVWADSESRPMMNRAGGSVPVCGH